MTAAVIAPPPAVMALPATAATPPGPGGLDEAGLAAAVRTIQNVCFASYPPDLLKSMTGLAGAPPPEIMEDPRRQITLLKTEAVVAKGLFYPSLLEDLVPALLATLRPGARLLDLGSGDGRVVFLASLLGARATGIEYDRALHRVAIAARDRLNSLVDPDHADLRRGDFFRADYADYDVLYYYKSGAYAETRLGLKIASELRPDAVLLVLAGEPEDFPDLEPVATYGPVRVFRRRAP